MGQSPATILTIPPEFISARQYAGRDGFICAGIPVSDPRIVEDIAAAYDPRLFMPLRVRDLGGGRYELLDGHHRLAAALLLELPAVPVAVVEVNGEVDRLALQVAANNAVSHDPPETLGRLFTQLCDDGMPEPAAARQIGKSVSTARKYAALFRAPQPVQEWYRDGRIPLEAVAMIGEYELAPGTQRRLAEYYITEKAIRPKFQPADFRLFCDEYARQLMSSPPRMTQTLLLNGEEDPVEAAAFERAEKAMTRARRIDLERDIAAALKLLQDPQVEAAVAARLEVITGWIRQAVPDAR